MTQFGGDSDLGVVFKMNTDGTGFQLLHEFASGVNDGARPYGDLIQGGSVLYGMTEFGGDSARGVVFKINTDGTGFQLLREFAGGVNDGQQPPGNLIRDGSVLYGMTVFGGDSNGGVVFKMNTDGTGFSLLHEFAGGVNDGLGPIGSLIRDGTVLYGMTQFGSLIRDGTVLYGMTQFGGDSDLGVVFKMNTDGTGFQLLHEFAGGNDDGGGPYGDLILDGSVLYGMTPTGGGGFHVGVVFKMNTDGTGFQLLHRFAGGNDDGENPLGSLIKDGAVLYGMTYAGGDSASGVVFKFEEDPPTLVQLTSFAATAGEDSVILEWTTASEVDNAGFHVWRSDAGDGEYVRITEGLIPAEGSEIAGAEYSYEDHDAADGGTDWYKLEDIDLHGVSTFHGPVSAMVAATATGEAETGDSASESSSGGG
jgi:uncharacterized repeat protein (TIGR03803 family)